MIGMQQPQTANLDVRPPYFVLEKDAVVKKSFLPLGDDIVISQPRSSVVTPSSSTQIIGFNFRPKCSFGSDEVVNNNIMRSEIFDFYAAGRNPYGLQLLIPASAHERRAFQNSLDGFYYCRDIHISGSGVFFRLGGREHHNNGAGKYKIKGVDMARNETLKTLDQARADFDRKGKAYAEWAREHGFSPMRVYDVLLGRSKGIRGESHRVAVALGVKHGEAETASQ